MDLQLRDEYISMCNSKWYQFGLHELDVAFGKPARRRYCMHGCKVQSAPTSTVSCISSLHAYSYSQQSDRIVKTRDAKNTKKITDSCECGREHNLRCW